MGHRFQGPGPRPPTALRRADVLHRALAGPGAARDGVAPRHGRPLLGHGALAPRHAGRGRRALGSRGRLGRTRLRAHVAELRDRVHAEHPPVALGRVRLRRLLHGGVGPHLRHRAATALLDRDALARRTGAAAAGAALADRGRGGARGPVRGLGRRARRASGRGHCSCGPGSSGPCSSRSACCCSRCSTSSRPAAVSPRCGGCCRGRRRGSACGSPPPRSSACTSTTSPATTACTARWAPPWRSWCGRGCSTWRCSWASRSTAKWSCAGPRDGAPAAGPAADSGPEATPGPRAYNRDSRQPARPRPQTTAGDPCPTCTHSSKNSAVSPQSATSSSSRTTTSVPRCRTPPTTPATRSSSRASRRRTRTASSCSAACTSWPRPPTSSRPRRPCSCPTSAPDAPWPTWSPCRAAQAQGATIRTPWSSPTSTPRPTSRPRPTSAAPAPTPSRSWSGSPRTRRSSSCRTGTSATTSPARPAARRP